MYWQNKDISFTELFRRRHTCIIRDIAPLSTNEGERLLPYLESSRYKLTKYWVC